MSEFVENLQDVFSLYAPIRAKRMFGGYGIYRGDVMFGLVADDVLYLKADDETKASFLELGLPPFEYERRGKKITMSYYAAPDVLFDDPEIARVWAARAHDAALRSQKSKRSRKTKR